MYLQCSTVITLSVHLEEKQHNRNAIKLANVFWVFFHGADLSIDYLLFLLSVSLTTTCAGMPIIPCCNIHKVKWFKWL